MQPSSVHVGLHPRVTPGAIALVARFEGWRPHAAALPQGGFVIGHGHVSAADPGRAVTPQEARALLAYDLSRVAAAVEPLILAPVGDHAFEALLSFAFAVGVEGFARSAVLRLLNAGAYLDAAAAIELWRCADVEGETWVVDVLVRRRAAEKARFLEPPEGFAPAPSAELRAAPDASLLATAASLSAADGRVALVDLDAEGGPRLRRPPGIEGEPAPSAALAAIAALSARLDRLFADPEGDLPPPPPVEAPPPPTRASIVEPAPEPETEPEPEPEPAAPTPSPETPKPTPLPPSITPVAPFPPKPPREPPTAHRAEPRVSPPSPRGPAYVLGLFGLALFAVAVRKTYQAPSLLWLALGLLAVAAMVPASLFLIGPRRRDED